VVWQVCKTLDAKIWPKDAICDRKFLVCDRI